MALHHPGRSIALALAMSAGFNSPALAEEPSGSAQSKIAAPQESIASEPPVLQVAGPPFPPAPAPAEAPLPPPPPPVVEPRVSDGAGPRLTFGRSFTPGLNPGFYGRFETEYFEVRNNSIVGALLGLEGWGAQGGAAGGGAIPVSMYVGARGGPFKGPKAPSLFFTLGVGVDVVVFDRIGTSDGFGLFSPFGVVTTGIEIVPGLRLLGDGRAVYRWHWTSRSEAQYQLGLTLGLNSYLWDGP